MRLDRPIVVDASVAVKWVMEEELSNCAQALLEGSMALGLPLIAPPHFTGEFVNAPLPADAAQGERHPNDRGRSSGNDGTVPRRRSEAVEPTGFYAGAFALARVHRLPNIYDALYVALAQLRGQIFGPPIFHCSGVFALLPRGSAESAISSVPVTDGLVTTPTSPSLEHWPRRASHSPRLRG